MSESEHQLIFARSIARQAGFDEGRVDVDAVLRSLNAHYEFEKSRLLTAAREPEYNVLRHRNDLFDAEQLIYLADPTLHLLTNDVGFNRAKESLQGNRIHVVQPDRQRGASRAEETIRNILNVAGTAY